MGVLRDLASILHIPAPTTYQIVERPPTPPNQKLGMYKTIGKDGKAGGEFINYIFAYTIEAVNID